MNFKKYLLVILIFLVSLNNISCNENGNSDGFKKVFDEGMVFFEKGDMEEAIKCFDKALEIDPNSVETLNIKGRSLGYMSKTEEALECFNKAIEVDPNICESWDNKGLALGFLGRDKEAIECFDRALEIIETGSGKSCCNGI